MEISLKNMGYTLLILVAFLMLLNFFFIMPYLRVNPEPIPLIEEEVAESAAPVTSAAEVDTLAVIKKSTIGENMANRTPEATSLRNPFYWPEDTIQQKKVEKIVDVMPAADRAEPEKPQLSMVIISKGRKQALLGDVFVREGDSYLDYRVKSIEEDRVVLSYDLGEINVFLQSGTEEGDRELPSSELIER